MFECYGTADLGLVAYETEARSGLVADEALIVEIVRPGTGDPVPAGEVGELVVTVFNPDYPLIRFATGDLTAQIEGDKPLRTHQHAHQGLDGARRSVDQGAWHVRAMPEQIDTIVKRHEAFSRARLVVRQEGNSDLMLLRCETDGKAEELVEAACRKNLDGSKRHRPAGDGGAACAGRAARRRQGHRRPAQPEPNGARLEARDIALERGGRLLLEDLCFELDPGDALLLVGPNGCGKSSLLRMLSRLSFGR